MTPETGPPSIEAEPAKGRWRWILGHRQRFLIDPRGQLRTVFMTAGVASLVITALLVSLHLSRMRTTEILVAKMPDLAPMLAQQNRVEFGLQLAGALVFLTTIAVVTLLETHKTSGAAFNIRRNVERVRDGEYGARVRLRRGDNLQDLARAFNEMSIALDERVWREIDILETLTAQIENVSTPEEVRQLVESLEHHASTRREAADPVTTV